MPPVVPRHVAPAPLALAGAGKIRQPAAMPCAASRRITAASSARVRFISSNKGGTNRMAGASAAPIRIIHSVPAVAAERLEGEGAGHVR